MTSWTECGACGTLYLRDCKEPAWQLQIVRVMRVPESETLLLLHSSLSLLASEPPGPTSTAHLQHTQYMQLPGRRSTFRQGRQMNGRELLGRGPNTFWPGPMQRDSGSRPSCTLL